MDFTNPTLVKLGKKYGKSPAQVMIRWCIEQGAVPLPKSVTPARMQENIDVFDFELSAQDMKELGRLNRNYRTAWDPTHVA
jgi:diketogulonate reductase-like aldo/keto reductase